MCYPAVLPDTLKEKKKNKEKVPEPTFAPPRQTSPPHHASPHPSQTRASVAVAACCLNPAGRPGAHAPQAPAVPINRPPLEVLHQSHLQTRLALALHQYSTLSRDVLQQETVAHHADTQLSFGWGC